MLHLKAVEACLQAEGRAAINLKFIFEGEEGAVASTRTTASGLASASCCAADLAVISDTPMFAPGMPSIGYGLRGITYWQVDVEDPNSDLHRELRRGGGQSGRDPGAADRSH